MSDLKRVIPCLDVNDGRVVKGTNFIDIRDAGGQAATGVYFFRIQTADGVATRKVTFLR